MKDVVLAVKTPIRLVGPVTARLLCAIKEPETVAFELKDVVLAVKTPIRLVGPVTARLLCAIKEPETVALELTVVVLADACRPTPSLNPSTGRKKDRLRSLSVS